jgi:hypothetical protein
MTGKALPNRPLQQSAARVKTHCLSALPLGSSSSRVSRLAASPLSKQLALRIAR